MSRQSSILSIAVPSQNHILFGRVRCEVPAVDLQAVVVGGRAEFQGIFAGDGELTVSIIKDVLLLGAEEGGGGQQGEVEDGEGGGGLHGGWFGARTGSS